MILRSFASIDIDPATTKASSGSEIFLLSMERYPVKWNYDIYIYISIYTHTRVQY